MIEITVYELVKNNLPDMDDERYSLYIVRDNNTIFYIGQSMDNVINRLYQHLGMGGGFSRGPSLLGHFIYANLPDSLKYQIELLTIQDVLPECPPLQFTGHIDTAEQELIKRLRPCLNISHNYDPSPLPKHYKDPRVPTEAEERAMKEAVDKLPPLSYKKHKSFKPGDHSELS